MLRQSHPKEKMPSLQIRSQLLHSRKTFTRWILHKKLAQKLWKNHHYHQLRSRKKLQLRLGHHFLNLPCLQPRLQSPPQKHLSTKQTTLKNWRSFNAPLQKPTRKMARIIQTSHQESLKNCKRTSWSIIQHQESCKILNAWFDSSRNHPRTFQKRKKNRKENQRTCQLYWTQKHWKCL